MPVHPADLPPFSAIDPASFPGSLEHLLTTNLETVETLLKHTPPTRESLIAPLEVLGNALEMRWSPLSHLQSVSDSASLRTCVETCLPKLSQYESALGHHVRLYEAVSQARAQERDPVWQHILDDALRDFRLSGVALSETDKKRFEAIDTRLAELAHQFENHVLDATAAFGMHIEDAQRLAGLPDHAVSAARERAEKKGIPGWWLSLDYPSFQAVITYAEDRELRKTMHEAWHTRASETGPHGGQFDNSALMLEILRLRREKAKLLGFAHYGELSLATKMAPSPDAVVAFLTDLCDRARPQAVAEFETLKQFAKTHCGMDTLMPWDIAFVSEKQREACFSINQETLRPWFTEEKVLEGLFAVVQRLYGVTFEPVNNEDVWHPDVRCYALLDASREVAGFLYADLFAREHKRGGAWMDSLRSRFRTPENVIQLPVATLTCNFAKPGADKPATLSHEEVVTLFHEMGHCLHHLLTRVDSLQASGIHGVEWDGVELPSQFFENWCWDFASLRQLTAHAETGEPLPEDLHARMLAARNYQSALAMLRQVEFALFDFRLHQADPDGEGMIGATLEAVREKTAVLPRAPWMRFQHSFTHIFGGGYAAGYYSYLWAEVLSCDAFSRFEEEGIFSEAAGRDFMHHILERGSTRPLLDGFVAFRGRPPVVDALLRHNGIGELLPPGSAPDA